MSKKNQQSLSSLLKKQIKADNSRKMGARSALGSKKSGSNGNGDKKITKGDLLREAKKSLKNNNASYDKSLLIKTLMIDYIIRSVFGITALVVFMGSIIKFGPAFVDLIRVVIRNLIIALFTN